MKYRLMETKEIIDRILAFSEAHSGGKHEETIGRIMEMYQEYPAVFRRLHVYEVVPVTHETDIRDSILFTSIGAGPYVTPNMKLFRTKYIFIKTPWGGIAGDMPPETLTFSDNDLKCLQRIAMANPRLLRFQSVYSKWDLEWSWSQSSFFSIFLQMLWSIKGDLLKGGDS